MTNKEMLIRIESKIDSLSGGIMKVVYALIGVIAATIGVRFVNSPLPVIISSYMAAFSGAFVLISVIHKWKSLNYMKKALRLVFSVFIVISVYCRDIVVPRPPEWYDILINTFFIILSVLMVISVWKDNSSV